MITIGEWATRQPDVASDIVNNITEPNEILKDMKWEGDIAMTIRERFEMWKERILRAWTALRGESEIIDYYPDEQ